MSGEGFFNVLNLLTSLQKNLAQLLSMNNTSYNWQDAWQDFESSFPRKEGAAYPDTLPLKGSVNGTCKLEDNYEQKLTRIGAISRLKTCGYKSSFTEIANYLETIFGIWEEQPNHWQYIAQYYTPKSINSVINQMVKMHERGALPLKSPGAYFTYVITTFHKPRKEFRKRNWKFSEAGKEEQNETS